MTCVQGMHNAFAYLLFIENLSTNYLTPTIPVQTGIHLLRTAHVAIGGGQASVLQFLATEFRNGISRPRLEAFARQRFLSFL